ncbi:sirohydrochlorin chelatase [Lysinibacillus odysseyi]|uniref:Sirohydrochlorin ferrochelatase n=1 Tax=Lysinibacillus odysseyi 34hs-1 = NBRC 100172 TaxID=1220589 RepID=A0A0A3ISV3_9BACI|nr:sirohydrochlorin chelatase [Lysinibacillus odysseyi]KGR87766.1 sirohydrochlorin ferrochelatase [Lysinibacillus odysseyi 34hs-1 = NBRC 100172]
MQAVLYVAHGSRVREGVNEALAFIKGVIPHINAQIQQESFLELAEPTIMQGVAACVEQGATEIAVAPILLLTANHLNEDIPREIQEAKRKFPEVTFSIGQALGIDDRLVNVLEQRLNESGESYTGANVLLVGRGSSDPAVKRDLTQIGGLLQKKAGLNKVSTCFLYGKGVSFEDALQQLVTEDKKTFIIPYLLFTGLLKQHIREKIANIQNFNQAVHLCDCLGYDEQVQHVFINRITQLMKRGDEQ